MESAVQNPQPSASSSAQAIPGMSAAPTPILYTIPNFITAGSGRAMLNIVERLDRNIYAPTICVQKRGGKLEREIERQGIPLLEAPFTTTARPYPTLAYRCWKLAKFFRPHRFKLWHSFHYSDDYTEPLIARFAGCRNWMYTKKNMMWRGRAWKMRTYFARAIAAQNSEMIESFFVSRNARSKARLVPCSVDASTFTPGERASMNGASTTFDAAPLIGCVANILPIKGQACLIEALPSIPGARLLLAGPFLDENYRQSLSDRAQELGLNDRVAFLGPVSDVVGFLRSLDVFILPTEPPGEGCSAALLEAMACGKGCVATSVGGSKDVIEHGASGLLVKPGDVSEIIDAIRRLLDDANLCSSMGVAARLRVEQRYDIWHEVKAYQDIYASLLSSRA
jgi:glycosyltransferase involved in cell wall biosynthesis